MGSISHRKRKELLPPHYNRDFFIFSKVIGKGGFGKVWKVYDKKTKQIYALKVIDKAKVLTKKSLASIMNERDLLVHLACDESEFIVNLKCAFQDRQNCYLLIDYLESGDLRYYINNGVTFNQSQIRFLIRCILEGLSQLHKRSIIHRDIKPENIILDKMGYARITDIGVAKYWRSQNSTDTSGTPGYMAPEVLLRRNHSFCADLYAVGVIAYELFVGNRPYKEKERKALREEMLLKEAKIPTEIAARMSKEAVDFTHRLLQRTSRKRLGYCGMLEVLMHPWLYKNTEERLQFLQKKMISPIIPKQVIFGKNLQQDTQPDEVWRENILLLKRPQIQELFKGYEFSLAESQAQSLKGSTRTTDSTQQQSV